MSYCRPAGYSDDEEDDDEFEFSSGNDRDYQYRYEEPEESSESTFYTALKDGDLQTMKDMLAQGFQVDQPLSGGWSPLMHASSLGKFPVVEFLVEAKANVNFNKDLFNSLMALCKCTSVDKEELLKCANLLLNNGANVNAIDRNACSALMYACDAGNVELVKRLLECNCDVNVQDSEGWSALFHAVDAGNEEIVKSLIDAKARVDLIDRRRRSAFELATQKGYGHLAKLVCSKKEKRRLKEDEENLSPMPETPTDPVEAMLDQLPGNDKNLSGFSNDVSKLLFAMGLGHHSKKFAENNVQLNEFLLITDDRLKELGVRFSVHRQRILNCIRQFHLHQWNKASLGMKPRNQQMDVEDALRLMCNTTKHLYVLNSTMSYLRLHQPAPVSAEVVGLCERAAHQLSLISGELQAISSFATGLKERERIEPVDLIKPVEKPKKNFVPVLAATVIIGVVLWRSKFIVPFWNFNYIKILHLY